MTDAMTQVEKHPMELIAKGELKIEEPDEEGKDTLKAKIREEANRQLKHDYIKSLRNKLHE